MLKADEDNEKHKNDKDTLMIREDEFDDHGLEVGRLARRKSSIVGLSKLLLRRPSKTSVQKIQTPKISLNKHQLTSILPWNGTFENW